MKYCSSCSLTKDYISFSKNTSFKDGLSYWCKVCMNDANKICYEKTKEKVKERKRLYWLNNKEKLQKKRKLYYSKNKKRINSHNIEYNKKRYKTNDFYRLQFNLRMRTNKILKQKRFYKSLSTKKYLGCDPEYLRNYIEKKFTYNMSWNNYGILKDNWSIDHIIPLSSAKTVEELYKLCHYTNLQPLWHIENIKKGNKLNYVSQNMEVSSQNIQETEKKT